MEEMSMKEWLLFALFLIVGLGMLIAGIFYMRKEKNDADSVRIYRVVSIIGAVLTIGAVAYQVLA
jgi:F0F1-type ATP synthase membrane subunit c/vacuolar-type H+-ATPase subunit K